MKKEDPSGCVGDGVIDWFDSAPQMLSYSSGLCFASSLRRPLCLF